jgi:hypothetical protein
VSDPRCATPATTATGPQTNCLRIAHPKRSLPRAPPCRARTSAVRRARHGNRRPSRRTRKPGPHTGNGGQHHGQQRGCR